jgi:hypothetical protein
MKNEKHATDNRKPPSVFGFVFRVFHFSFVAILLRKLPDQGCPPDGSGRAHYTDGNAPFFAPS